MNMQGLGYPMSQGGLINSGGAASSSLNYGSYLQRQRTGNMITGKVGMQSKFMDYSKLTQPGVMPAQNKNHVKRDPLQMKPNPRQTMRFDHNVDQMLSAAGLKQDESTFQKELEEDLKQDLGAEAMDELDAMLAEDLASSDEGSEKDD